MRQNSSSEDAIAVLKEENRKLKGPGKPMLNIAPQSQAKGNDRELTKLTVENDRLKK